jgi:hypothetical protein
MRENHNKLVQLQGTVHDAYRRGHASLPEFIVFCERAFVLKHLSPRTTAAEIAELVVSMGSLAQSTASTYERPTLKEITDLAADLELPDAHVDTSDGLGIDDKWLMLESLVAEL